MTDRLQALSDAGVSIWLDDLSRERIETGNLAELIKDKHVVGVTTNPTIFASAIGNGERYDEQVRKLVADGADVNRVIFELTTEDVRNGCEIFTPVYESTKADGRVSIEVEPDLANDTGATIASAQQLWEAVDRPNVYIKIPATEEGLPAITAAISQGINVNVTLIFSVERYRGVMDAYLSGLEAARDGGLDLSRIFSVASFFVSRVDTEVDKRLDEIGTDEAKALRGKAAVANAVLAYQAYEEVLASDRWKQVADAGANPQRPLWASTGVKNPDYSDTLYVTDLVVDDTVNTMPEKTLEAFADHGEVRGDQVTGKGADAQALFDQLGRRRDRPSGRLPRAGGGRRRQVQEVVDRARRDGREADGAGGPVTDGPVDATATEAWRRLTELADGFQPDLRAWFAEDAERASALTFTAADLLVDLSKGLVTGDVLTALLALAEQVGVAGRRDAMFRGDRVNVTEDRAVLHTALRLPEDAVPNERPSLDGQDVVTEVHDVLRRVYDFADRVRSGAWTGVTGERIRTVVNIGIGGSDLGPVMAYEALAPYRQAGLECRFISNIDPTDAATTLAGLDPASTLFIVSSKTFGTLETLTNARLCKAWLLDGLSDQDEKEAVARHFVAVSTALDKVADFGIDPDNAFGFWDWVGGRYSMDSAIGTSLVVAVGPERFAELLAGMHAMDEHFRTTEPARNVPLLMGLLNVWYTNFLDAQTHAVLPYSQLLHRFPAYLQQLTMESNGKGVRWDGTPVTADTGEVFWGEPGTNGQHAFYQLIHQGTRLVPADFIAFANPAYPLRDGETDVHELFLANFFAQTRALAFGKTAEEVRAEGTDEAVVPARVFPGNRPTASIMAPELTPSVLGQLIALYEHITFTEGAVWGIDSFDQWGVELGKQLAQQLAPAVAGDESVAAEQDSSTQSLIAYYRKQRR